MVLLHQADLFFDEVREEKENLFSFLALGQVRLIGPDRNVGLLEFDHSLSKSDVDALYFAEHLRGLIGVLSQKECIRKHIHRFLLKIFFHL